MAKTNYRGIDYGMGQSNVDRETGIRFGVISAHAITQAWYDSAEADYGQPHCPKCGNEAIDFGADNQDDPEATPDRSEYDDAATYGHSCQDYACDSCKVYFDGERAFGDEPCGYTLDDGEYKACDCLDSDVMILKSPFFTRAQFCSPCVPGACSIESPCDDGERTYCFAPDWFDSEYPCPYPIWRVDTGELIYSPPSEKGIRRHQRRAAFRARHRIY